MKIVVEAELCVIRATKVGIKHTDFFVKFPKPPQGKIIIICQLFDYSGAIILVVVELAGTVVLALLLQLLHKQCDQPAHPCLPTQSVVHVQVPTLITLMEHPRPTPTMLMALPTLITLAL